MCCDETEVMNLVKECSVQINRRALPQEIDRLENELNCTLSPDYRMFLAYTDGGEIKGSGITFFSVNENNADKTENTLSYVNSEAYERDELPENYIIVGEYSFKDKICLNKLNGHAIQWSHEDKYSIFEVDSFGDYLSFIVKMRTLFPDD